jgi:hypothetical protein
VWWYAPGVFKMNSKVSQKPIKLRNKFSVAEVYYTFSHWDSKEIEGVQFLPVVKNLPSNYTQPIHYMRKDSLEKVK